MLEANVRKKSQVGQWGFWLSVVSWIMTLILHVFPASMFFSWPQDRQHLFYHPLAMGSTTLLTSASDMCTEVTACWFCKALRGLTHCLLSSYTPAISRKSLGTALPACSSKRETSRGQLLEWLTDLQQKTELSLPLKPKAEVPGQGLSGLTNQL